MAKLDSKPYSFRLKKDAANALDDLVSQWGCTQTAAVERALIEMLGLVARGGEISSAAPLEVEVVGMDELRRIAAGETARPAEKGRESSYQRSQREARERENAARSRCSAGDDPSLSFDPEFVQG